MLFSAAVLPLSSREWKLSSPDGGVVAVINEDLSYTVTFNGKNVFAAYAGIRLENCKCLNTVKSPERKSVENTIISPFYRNSSIVDRYNQLTLKADKNWKIEFRAYSDGLAYRWVYSGKEAVYIQDEIISYSFVPEAKVTVGYIREDRCSDIESQFFNSFENEYVQTSVSALSDKRMAFLPLAVETAPDVKVLLTESDLSNYPGLYLLRDGAASLKGVLPRYPKKETVGGYLDIQKIVEEREDYIAHIDAARTLPWRMAIIADNDVGLAQSQLTYILAAPSKIEDTSWIKPGKVAWDWWNDWNIKGVDFEAGVNQETYRYYIDFAAANGIEYIIMDDGWSVKGCGDLFTVVPQIDLPGLVEYAADKGVGIILWAGYVPFEKDLETVCRHYSEMGIKGFKVDFFDRNDQKIEEFVDRAAEVAARYNLVLDLHGFHIPAGINRKWPNVLNTEGVNGLERLKGWDIRLDQVRYDTFIPFIRQAAGPMDYTQGAMLNGTRETYRPCNTQPMSQGTRCHQLALYAILDSPLNMLCDSPTNYEKEQECTDYIAEIPTVWDETIVLDGKMGEYCVTARRKGNDWYLGGITDWTPRDITLDLSFLPDGNYLGDWYVDGRNAARDASDYKRENGLVGVSKTIHLAPGGGFAAKLTRQKQTSGFRMR